MSSLVLGTCIVMSIFLIKYIKFNATIIGEKNNAIMDYDQTIRNVGVCVDTCSTLGICAERNAIFNMITNGEQKIEKVLAIMPNGKSGAPCGACRELMVQLMPNSYQEIEVLMDFETEEIVTLGELTPKWWI